MTTNSAASHKEFSCHLATFSTNASLSIPQSSILNEENSSRMNGDTRGYRRFSTDIPACHRDHGSTTCCLWRVSSIINLRQARLTRDICHIWEIGQVFSRSGNTNDLRYFRGHFVALPEQEAIAWRSPTGSARRITGSLQSVLSLLRPLKQPK